MKTLITLAFTLLLGLSLFAQSNELPEIKLKDLSGKMVEVNKLSNDRKPMIISFWATWCKPCVLELNTIQDDKYEDWQDEFGVELIAISIDDARNSQKIKPYVNGKGWDYNVLLDPNGDLKRAMNVNNVPHTFVLDGAGKIVWEHNSYSPGDEEELEKVLRKLSK